MALLELFESAVTPTERRAYSSLSDNELLPDHFSKVDKIQYAFQAVLSGRNSRHA